MFQNVLNYIIDLNKVSVTIKTVSDGMEYTVNAAQSSYFRQPLFDENIIGSGRQYVISTDSVEFKPKRGDQFSISPTEFYSIEIVDEMRAMGNVIGYRLTLA